MSIFDCVVGLLKLIFQRVFMKFSNLFFGSPTDSFFRRYALVIFMMSFLIYCFSTYSPGRTVSQFESWTFTISLFGGPLFWAMIFGAKKSYSKFLDAYPEVDLSIFSTYELFLKGQLFETRPDLDVLAMSMKEVSAEIKASKRAKKEAKNSTGFFTGLEKGFYGTNKKIRCINCGSRLGKGTFGGWSPMGPSACNDLKRSCVPIEEPSA